MLTRALIESMTPEEIKQRREAYQKILALGLLTIRDYAAKRSTEICTIEAEHLHNIPSLIDEENEHRHIHYAAVEKPSYLKRIQACADDEYIERTADFYREPWIVLMQFALRSQEEFNRQMEFQNPEPPTM